MASKQAALRELTARIDEAWAILKSIMDGGGTMMDGAQVMEAIENMKAAYDAIEKGETA